MYENINDYSIEYEQDGFRILKQEIAGLSFYALSFFDTSREQKWCAITMTKKDVKDVLDSNFDKNVLMKIVIRGGHNRRYLVEDPQNTIGFKRN